MANIIKLQETSSVTLNRQLTLTDKQFTEIIAVGDGNCAFNSFALALIELIITNKLQLDADNQKRLLDELQNSILILEERLKLYRGEASTLPAEGIGYSDLVTPLTNFIAFIRQEPDYNKFCEYVQQHAQHRLGVAALHIGLARALRDMSVKLYNEYLQQIGVDQSDKELAADAINLFDEGANAGHEALVKLSEKLQLNVKLFNGAIVLEGVEIPGAETVNLVHTGKGSDEHWNYLLPSEQKNGLARVLLPQVSLVSEVESQVQEEELLASRFKEARLHHHNDEIQAALDNAVHLTIKTSENLIKLKSMTAEASYQSLLEAHTKYSNAILRNVRKSVDLTKRNVESLRMATKLHESLLKGEVEANPAPLPEIYKADESLARTLQNAEILHFLSQHYSALTKEHLAKVKHEAELLHPPTPRTTAIR